MAISFATRGANGVSIGSAASLDNLSAFTYLLWVYPTDVTDNDYGLWGIGTFGGQNRKELFFDPTGTGNVGLSVDRATTDTLRFSTYDLSANTWYCIAATFDTSDTGHVYVGTLSEILAELSYDIVNTSGSGAVGNSAASTMYIGNIGNFDRSMIGRVGFAAIWNRALSLGELKAQQFRPRVTSGCVGFYRPGWNGTSSVPDWSGNANTGTITNGSAASGVPLGNPFGADSGWQGAFTAAAVAASPNRFRHGFRVPRAPWMPRASMNR